MWKTIRSGDGVRRFISLVSKDKTRIVWVRNEITPALEALPSKIRQQISKEFESQVPKVQSYMKRNAPWNDRTGNARATLAAEFMGDRYIRRQAIRISHGVPYGIYLETRFAQKYAIITPTIRIEGDRIISEITGMLGRMTGGSSFTPGISMPGLSI